MTAAITAMRDWLRTCPLVSDFEADGVAFRIDYLGAKALQFTIDDAPTDPVVQRYFSGTRRVKNYVLASRMEFSPDVAAQAANSGFWDELTAWIETQSDLRNLPDLGEGRVAESAACTTTGYIITSDDGTCRFQIQIQLVYYQQKGTI